jgi:tetratricopeptide (TPR) repeat protein
MENVKRIVGAMAGAMTRTVAIVCAVIAGGASTGGLMAQPDLLTVLGFHETGGAAPGYVEDRACATCHAAIWTRYQEVGMARSFTRPSRENAIERFGETFHHAPSQRFYTMRWDGDTLVFRREQRDAEIPDVEKRAFHVYETEVDWIMGSGNHARVYLTQNAAGELFQLPLAWYAPSAGGGSDPDAVAPGRWGMAPGFDRPSHAGLTRRVRRECMFCHNAYPDVATGSDAHGAPQVFPTQLPEGTGCQRCHGPGAQHVRLAFGGERDREKVRRAITNPGRLAPERRDDICFGCHLQPSVALAGIRRFGRGDYSFRPGEDLTDYLVPVDIDEEGRTRDERFEINHHPYRLRQSTCFLASPAGALSCVTCHDPHRKVPVAERAAHYRAVCQSCHQADACARPTAIHPDTAQPDTARSRMASADDEDAGERDTADCVSCHMSPRRPEDVVQVVMTDHRIRRHPGGAAWLAAREEKDPVLTGVEVYWPERAPTGVLGKIYRTMAVLRIAASADAIDHLKGLLARVRPPAREPWLAWGRGHYLLKRHDAAAAIFESLLGAHDETTADVADRHLAVRTRELLALARGVQGRLTEAVALLESVTAAHTDNPEAWYNLGRLLVTAGRPEDAERALEKAVALRPLLPLGWYQLGRVRKARGRPREAIQAFEQALTIEPTLTEVYLESAQTLVEIEDRVGAERVLRHGIQVVADPTRLDEALAALGSTENAETLP